MTELFTNEYLEKTVKPFMTVMSTRYPYRVNFSVAELTELAEEAYNRGGTASLLFRKLVDFEADSQINCWSADVLGADKPDEFAIKQRSRRLQFKAHEWLYLKECMRNYEVNGVFECKTSLPSLWTSCAKQLKVWRSLISEPSLTVLTILDDDRKTTLTLWCNGRAAVPLSAWIIIQALATGVAQERDLLTLDYDMTRLGRVSKAGQQVLWLLS